MFFAVTQKQRRVSVFVWDLWTAVGECFDLPP